MDLYDFTDDSRGNKRVDEGAKMNIDPLKAEIKCDEPGCDWHDLIERQNIQDWHRRACPKCGKGEIINDDELFLLNMLIALESTHKRIYGDKCKPIQFDTAEIIRGVDKEETEKHDRTD